MLRWLKINRYRNVVPGTELTFSEGHHVVLGPNGGGKTTLLELIAAVLRGDFREYKDEEFSFEYRTADGADALTVALSHLRAVAPEPASSLTWQDSLKATLHRDESTAVTIELNADDVTLNGTLLLRRSLELTDMRLHRTILYLCHEPIRITGGRSADFTWDGVHRFDEMLSFFWFLKGKGTLDSSPFHLAAHLRDGQPKSLAWATCHSLFASAYDKFERMLLSSDDVERVALPLASLGSLGVVVDLLGFRSGLFRAELERQERTDDGETLTYERFQFRFIRRDGTMVLDEHLSFGQKRLLAFLFYAWANDGPIVADELVDGMHHRWVEHCLKTIHGRQAFLSSQNPLLMDFIGFDSAEKVQQTFVICDVEERDGRERMRWRNLTADEASEFFNAYEVGIQHVSEILRDKGLW